jgi:hypothetical protein
MTEAVAIWIGYAVMWLGAGCIVALLLAVCTYLWNWTSWKLLDAYGGIKVFNEYRAWYHEHKRASAGK